jgi:two-component system KDP operon response regulator KdpE
MCKTELLIIDDEAPIQKLLQITLESNDYKVEIAGTANEGLAKAAHHPPELIVLDLGLPDINGHEVLQQLRQWYTNAIIILSIQKSEEDIIKALDNGANDYLVKPFRTGELLARIRSALRQKGEEGNDPILHYGEMTIDFSARTVKKNGEAIKLTATEYNLLALFMNNEGKVLTHYYLLKQIWGAGYVNQSQYLRVFIAQLRKKIEADPNRPVYLVTESGIGYRFVSTE